MSGFLDLLLIDELHLWNRILLQVLDLLTFNSMSVLLVLHSSVESIGIILHFLMQSKNGHFKIFNFVVLLLLKECLLFFSQLFKGINFRLFCKVKCITFSWMLMLHFLNLLLKLFDLFLVLFSLNRHLMIHGFNLLLQILSLIGNEVFTVLKLKFMLLLNLMDFLRLLVSHFTKLLLQHLNLHDHSHLLILT